jgi:RNA polymerase sigma-70 factor (ECF subfamily)
MPTAAANPTFLLNILPREENARAGEETAETLAAQCQGGSLQAYERLVERFEKRIYNFLYHRTGNAHDAQDLTQESFVRAWRNIARFDTKRDFATWLFVIARRAAANHFRARKIHDELPDDISAAECRDVEAHDSSAYLWKAARRLKPRAYEALWLRYAEDFSVNETAHILGLTTIHTKVILHRARNELARYLKKENL